MSSSCGDSGAFEFVNSPWWPGEAFGDKVTVRAVWQFIDMGSNDETVGSVKKTSIRV